MIYRQLELVRRASWTEICSKLVLGCAADILRLQVRSRLNTISGPCSFVVKHGAPEGAFRSSVPGSRVRGRTGKLARGVFQDVGGVSNRVTEWLQAAGIHLWSAAMTVRIGSCRNGRFRWPLSDLAHELIWKWLYTVNQRCYWQGFGKM